MKFRGLMVLILTWGLISSAFAAEHPHVYGGIPSNGSFIERQGYIIQFNAQKKTPKWVAYHIDPSFVEDLPPREESQWGKFRQDPDLSNESTEKDYKNQFRTWRNYAKGHLAPYFISGGDRNGNGQNAAAGDAYDGKTVHEIMYMSNMAPQHHNNFNGSGGLWYKLETHVREELVRTRQKKVWVTAGCIYGPGKYDSIGANVEVPPMFFKIVVTEEEGKPVVLAFLFPHQIKKHGEIQDYLVSVNLLEAMTGLDFFPDIHSAEWEAVERQSTWENWR